MQTKKAVLLYSFCLLLIGCTGPKTEKTASSKEKLAPIDQINLPANERSNVLAASQILIAYEGAASASLGVTRKKAEALEKANRIASQLLENPELFEALARNDSDGPFSDRGGYLGSFPRGMMVKPFEEAVERLSIDEITPSPIETVFGYFIIR